MIKNKILMLFTIFTLVFKTSGMENDNKSLPLPEELKFELFESIIKSDLKNCNNFDKFRQLIKKINVLKCVSKSFENEISQVLSSIKSRLNNNKLNDLDLDYKLALLIEIIEHLIDYPIANIRFEERTNFFINSGNDINLRDKDGDSAFLLAVASNHKIILEILIQKGADINETAYYNTALKVAAQCNSIEALKVLLKYDKNVNRQVFDYHNRDHHDTALNIAASLGHNEITEILLKHNADINLKDNHDRTTLMIAAENGQTETVDLLLSNGAFVNFQDDNGETALMRATKLGYNKIIDLLIKHNADLNLINNKNKTALMLAQEKYKLINKEFKKYNADMQSNENPKKFMALLAWLQRYQDIINMLTPGLAIGKFCRII